MDRSSSPCPHDDDRICLPAIPPPRSGGTEKKESQDHRRNPVCPQSGRPSLITYPGRRLPVAPNAVTASVKRQSNFCQSSARDPTGGFPSRPAALKTPHKQAGHMKATDQSHRDHKALAIGGRSEEHTSELQSLMRNSYAVFCLTKKTQINKTDTYTAQKDTLIK